VTTVDQPTRDRIREALSSPDLEREVAARVTAMVTAMPDVSLMLAAATYLASGAWSRRASEMKDGIIMEARRLRPDETYQETADRLGVSTAVVNRAAVRDAVREREATA
jgi:hypothetical protein